MKIQQICMIKLIMIILSLGFFIQPAFPDTTTFRDYFDYYDVIWNSQSANAAGSMPLGGGDIGLNVWVENNELMFYLARSGTFDENNSMLKLGRVRVKLDPNPFSGNSEFSQQLKLRDGCIFITGKNQKCSAKINMWVDVYCPTVHIDIECDNPVNVEAIYETWRTEDYLLPDMFRSQCFSYSGYPGEVTTYKDTIAFENDGVLWYHRNCDDKLIYDFAIEQQGLSEYRKHFPNTQKGRTFGGMMSGSNMKPAGNSAGKYVDTDYKGWKLKTQKPQKETNIKLYLHVDQTENLQDWKDGLNKILRRTNDRKTRAKQQTRKWWNDFSRRSYIYINPQNPDRFYEHWQIGRNYQLFRYMLGCNAYGDYPSKFNGSLFTVDPVFVDDKYKGGTPDYRSWGGGSFTAQNQRLVYWPLLKSGDFDMFAPQFNYYNRILDAAETRSRVYWGHQGACYTEQLENFGLPFAAGWGFKNSSNKSRIRTQEDEFGVQVNPWTKYQYNHQLEFASMIIEYHKYSGRSISEYMPFIKSSIKFFSEHYKYRNVKRCGKPYDENGKLVLYPSTCLETYKDAKNPTDVIAALDFVLNEVIKLPAKYASDEDKVFWEDMLQRLPDIPIKDHGKGKFIAPAISHGPNNNKEIPEMYVVYPYGLYGVGLPDLDLALNTWENGISVVNKYFLPCWSQVGIFAARLGLTNEASYLVIDKLKNSPRRFPAFWGPGPDWVPDVDHGGSGMIALQEMLVQCHGDRILLLPAWPKEWDVKFKLHLPKKTVLKCTVKGGNIINLEVTPKSRMKDVEIMNDFGKLHIKDGITLTGFHPNITERPRLGAKPGDREKMQQEINSGGKKKEQLLKMKEKLEPYIIQHETDPDYLMSRMPMHWGRHYTSFPAYGENKPMEWTDFESPYKPSAPCVMTNFKGKSLDMRKRSGHAPVPTMRVGFGQVKTSKGNAPKMPGFGKIDAYNGDLFLVRDSFDKNILNYLPLSGSEICDYYKGLHRLTVDAAKIYFWTGEERYAKFACDYLMQWVLGIYFQNPYNRPRTVVGGKVIENTTTGVNGMDISAGYMKPFSWIYDFCYDYLQKNQRHYLEGQFYPHRKGEVDHDRLKKAMKGKKINEVVDAAFFKFVYHMILETVLVENIECPNNHCIWSQQSADFFLAIEDDLLRARGMDVIVYSDQLCRDTDWGWGAHGSISVNTTVKNAFTDDGFWKESTVYQKIATGRVVSLLKVLDNAGYDVWEQNKRVFNSGFAPFRIMYPNRHLASFGDASDTSFKKCPVDFFYRTAKKHDMPETEKLGKQLRWAIDHGFTKSLSAEEMEDLPEKGVNPLTRTDHIKYVPLFLQRNKSLDAENGLMSTMYCGNYTHCLPEGINFEYYAKGLKMVPHVGYYPYGSKPHRQYCQTIGSKNTVIPGDLPLTMEQMETGKYDLELYAMEPAAQADAVSPAISFIETGLNYGGRQRRCMALIRTSETSGYLFDIFRSSNDKSNEYRLHSIGDQVTVYDHDGRKKLAMKPADEKMEEELGDHYIEDEMKSATAPAGNLKTIFAVSDEKNRRDLEFNVFMPGRDDYTIYTYTGFPRKAAFKPYDKMRAPAIAVRLESEAWNRPFVSVYEAAGKGQSTIKSVNRLSDGTFTALRVDGTKYKHLIFSSESPDTLNKQSGCTLKGTFAVLAKNNKQQEYYLGKGTELKTPVCSIESIDGEEISASVRINGHNAIVSTTANCKVTINSKTKTFNAGMNQPF